MDAPELDRSRAVWRTSSYSNNGGACIEVADLPGIVAIRDSKDRSGPVLVLTRPAKVMKSRVVVTRPDGAPVGEIVQANVFGKIRFDLVAGGRLVGAIQAENWRAWNFAITDSAGTEVARITKTWEGLAKTLFTTADNYVVHVHTRLPDPLASLVIASALTVDTALKQDDRGFN